MTLGWRKGNNPHPLFDTKRYLQWYPDVLEADKNHLSTSWSLRIWLQTAPAVRQYDVSKRLPRSAE